MMPRSRRPRRRSIRRPVHRPTRAACGIDCDGSNLRQRPASARRAFRAGILNVIVCGQLRVGATIAARTNRTGSLVAHTSDTGPGGTSGCSKVRVASEASDELDAATSAPGYERRRRRDVAYVALRSRSPARPSSGTSPFRSTRRAGDGPADNNAPPVAGHVDSSVTPVARTDRVVTV